MNNLDQALLKGHWVNPNELILAKEYSNNSKRSIFSIFIKLGYMTEDDVFLFFSEISNISFVRPSDYKVEEDVLNIFPEGFCRENNCIPLFKIDNDLFVAMANPLDTDLIMHLEEHSSLFIQPLVATPFSISKALDYYFGYEISLLSMEDVIFKPTKFAKFPFNRESERVSLSVPLEFKVEDELVSLSSGQYIPSNSFDVSKNAQSLGIKTFLFIPPQVKLSLRFILSESNEIEVKAVVVQCRMEKKGKFLIGLRLIDIDPSLTSYLKNTK